MSARDRETAEALVRFAASLDGAVLGLGTAAVAIASWVKYLAVARELRLVTSATAASIAGLRSILPEDGEPRLVAVRGFVRTLPGGKYLRAPGSGEYGVVTKHTQMVGRLGPVIWRRVPSSRRTSWITAGFVGALRSAASTVLLCSCRGARGMSVGSRCCPIRQAEELLWLRDFPEDSNDGDAHFCEAVKEATRAISGIVDMFIGVIRHSSDGGVVRLRLFKWG